MYFLLSHKSLIVFLPKGTNNNASSNCWTGSFSTVPWRNENENFLLLFFFFANIWIQEKEISFVLLKTQFYILYVYLNNLKKISLLLIHSDFSLTLELLFPSPIKLFVKKTTHSIVLLLYFLRNLPNENGFCFLFFYYVSVHTQTQKM